MSAPDWTAPTALYRHFDAGGVLLYVGIATNHIARLQQHSKGSHWSKDIRQVVVEMFPDRWAALDAEENVIKGEKPKHNVFHNSAVRRARKPEAPVKAAIDAVPGYQTLPAPDGDEWILIREAARIIGVLTTDVDAEAQMLVHRGNKFVGGARICLRSTANRKASECASTRLARRERRIEKKKREATK